VLSHNDADRLIPLALDATNYRIDFFEGEDRSKLTANAILKKLRPLAPEFERSLNKGGDNIMWSKRAQDLLEALIDIDLHLRRNTPDTDIWKIVNTIGEIGKLKGLQLPQFEYLKENYFDSFQDLIAAVTALPDGNTNGSAKQQYFWGQFCVLAIESGVPLQVTTPLVEMGSTYAEAYAALMSLMNSLLVDLSLKEIAEHLSLNPIEPPERYLSIKDAIDQGKILLYTPDTTNTAAIHIGKALKTKFFQFALRRKNKQRAVVYAADEFQRFITGDPESGEQSFLDRCRAYRAICILVTQSISSLMYELKQYDPSGTSQESLQVVINNTGNKYFFRNTDAKTGHELRGLIPTCPAEGRPSIIDARTMTTLKPGECYYLSSSGEWGRKQICV